MDYYFLISSLPNLRFEDAPPLTAESFDAMVRAELTDPDRMIYDAARLEPDLSETLSPDSAAWRFMVWETQLRNTLALRRQTDLRLPPAVQERDCPDLVADIPENANRALQADTPLEAARALDLMRWNQLESLTVMHPFDVDFLCVYKLKLALLAKWQPRQPEAGKKNFDACLEKIEKMNV